MAKSLFVISQVAHADRAQQLADQLGLTDVEVIVVYTRRNMSMPMRTQAAIDHARKWAVRLIEIHTGSSALSYGATKAARQLYSRLLDEILPDTLFVCSFERHYAILCEEAQKRGVRLAYFEEGTSIYKTKVPGYSTFYDPGWNAAFADVYKRVWADQPIARYVIAPIVGAIRQIIALPGLFVKTGKRLYLMPPVQKRIIERRQPIFLNNWHDFEDLYASNPAILKGHFRFQNSFEFLPKLDDPAHIERTATIRDEFAIDGGTAIFASQPFGVAPAIQVPIVLGVLQDVARRYGYRIAIKTHPREGEAAVATYQKLIESYRLTNMFVLEGDLPPAEYLAIYTDSPAVISFSSSTLMYAPKYKPSLKSISIGKAVLNELAAAKIRNPNIKTMSDYIKILAVIPYIEQFEP